MANKNRKPRKPAKKPTRNAQKVKKPAATQPKKRIRRSVKSTQVTGVEIDDALEDLANRTPLERKIDQKLTADEESHKNLLISTNYEESSPFDPDEDIDCEPENRTKMYEVPPKRRSPEAGNSCVEDEPVDNVQPPQEEHTYSRMERAANREYDYYFN